MNGNHTAQDTTGTESCYDTRSDGDKLEILAIDPLPGTHLKAGENVDVTVQVLYRLDSHYRGNVELYYLLPPTNHDRYSGGSAGFTQFEVFEGSEIIVIQGTFEVPDIGETEISAHLQPPLDDLRAAGYDCWSSMARELAATYYIDGTGSAELVSASRLPRVPVEKVVRTPVETPVNFSVNRTIGPAILFSDSSWKVSDEEERGWNEVGFDDTSWINAQVLWEYWDYDDFPPAQPMWHPGRHEDDFKWYFFRNSFSIPSVTTIRLAEITIQVDDDYVLYINGVEIGRDESGTTKPSSIYDILPYLNSGENVTGVKAIDSHGGNEGVNLKLEVAREESDTQEVAAYPVQGSDFHVIAHIDGRSQLVIRGNSVQWLHLDNAAPGREDIVTFPTIINGTSWMPEWPDEPTGENHDCQCVSSSFKGLEPPLPKAEIHAGLEIIAGRGVVFIVEMPTKENNYTLIVEFDDNRQEGPDWYEILIVVEPSFVQPTIAVAPTFGMTRGTTISGRVTDRKTGLPIANVEIKGEPFDEAGSYSDARTDADGRYTLREIAPGIYLIKARALREGYIEVFYNDKINWDDADLVTISGVGAVEGIDFDLTPGASISGRIIDMDTGLPIASMDVHAGLINGDRISSANTDGNGNYVLRGLPEGIIEIGANGHGYVEEHITVAISEAERIRGADLGLRLGTTISGRVFDAETGLPLANIHIRADNVFGKSGASEDTDADGRYILQAIAPGTYRIKAEGERKGYIRTFYDGKLGWGNADPVIVSGRSPIEGIDFGLQRGTSISGRVIDDETGLPISNVEISARPLGERNLSWDRTDSNGKYILKGLPVGVMEVQVNGQGYIKERISVVTREAQVVKAPDFRLRLGTTISGRVTDGETGLPIANVDIVADPLHKAGSHSYARTDSGGRYMLEGVAPGNYTIKVRAGLIDGDYISWANTDGNGNYVLTALPDGVIEVVMYGQGYIEVRRTVTIREGVDVTGFDF